MTTQELPKLSGSEKQVAWAEKIRGDILSQAERVLARAVQEEANPAPYDSEKVRLGNTRYREEMERLVAGLRAVDSARWWIDNRSGWGPLGLSGLATRLPKA
jgi:hypothetical protein